MSDFLEYDYTKDIQVIKNYVNEILKDFDSIQQNGIYYCAIIHSYTTIEHQRNEDCVSEFVKDRKEYLLSNLHDYFDQLHNEIKIIPHLDENTDTKVSLDLIMIVSTLLKINITIRKINSQHFNIIQSAFDEYKELSKILEKYPQNSPQNPLDDMDDAEIRKNILRHFTL